MQELLNLLIKYKISPNQLILLNCIQESIKTAILIPDLSSEILKLKEESWITNSNELLPKALWLLSEADKLFKNSKRKITIDTPDFLTNLKEYREMFPAGILPTGKPGRTHIDELKKKMSTFFINNPQYDWNLVLDATEAYVEYFRKQDYSFMKTAGYFIYKNNESDLASYCEKLLEEGDNNNIKKSIYNI